MVSGDSSRGTFLDSLVEADQHSLLQTGHPRRWERGELLMRAGDPADSAIVIRSGLVKIHRHTADGADVVLALRGPGDLLGEITAVRQAERSATATAVEPVEGVVIAVSALRRFLADHHRSTLALLDLALARLHVADTRRMEFVTSESLARVASRLVELAERFGVRREDGQIDVGLPITQDELASWSAASRESTARALRTLRALELIETGRLSLRVRDLAGLRSHAARL